MNQYKLCIIDQNLMEQVKECHKEILHSQKIIEGLIIHATSTDDAREKANINYAIISLNNYAPSMTLPEPPEVNSIKYCNAWLNKKLTSCELLKS